jgi:hypothetical protein
MKRALLAGESLADHASIFVDENGHKNGLWVTGLWATGQISVPLPCSAGEG